jgi:light-regulated signal transduction histidine kinase (bacteriophytochrome)
LEQLRQEQARAAEHARLETVLEANRELETFAYSVSHDLRAPLRNICGFLELLVQRTAGKLNAEEARLFNTVTREAARLSLLIDKLLAFSRLGRAELRCEPVALGELVDEVRAELATEIGARAIEWRVGELPVVQGDRMLLRQVVANLLSNAVKFTRGRPVAVIVVAAEAGADPRLATVVVGDNGAGFNPKYQEKLFGVFERLHTAREFDGLGIGLAIVRRILERHGGRIWAEGSVDKGAKFHFTVPFPRV